MTVKEVKERKNPLSEKLICESTHGYGKSFIEDRFLGKEQKNKYYIPDDSGVFHESSTPKKPRYYSLQPALTQ